MLSHLISEFRSKLRVSGRTGTPSLRSLVKNAWRVGLSRYYLRKCTRAGSLPRVWGRPRIANRGRLTIDEKLMLISTVVPSELVVRQGARLDIGNHVYINYGASIAAYESITIGDRCTIGTYCIITDNDQHDLIDRSKLPPSEPVVLEENVWVGDRVIILKGVVIGKGAVIGAGSVVTKSVPANCIAAGNPARVLRHVSDDAPADNREAVPG